MDDNKMIELAEKAFLKALENKKFSGLDKIKFNARIGGGNTVDCLAEKVDGTKITGTAYMNKKGSIRICIERVIERNMPRYPMYWVTLPLKNI